MSSPTISDADINAGLLTRYMTVAALIIVFYDYILFFRDERRLLWSSPRSLLKCIVLANRYLVPVCLLVSFIALSGFVGYNLTNNACRTLVAVIGACNFASLAVGNGLMTVQVIRLWDLNPIVKYVAWSGYAIAYITSFVFFIVGHLKQVHFEWSPELHSCIVTQLSPLVIPIWGIPLLYEGMLLMALIWNAVDRPRMTDTSIVKLLRKDGIIFFLVMTASRVLQLCLVATQRPIYYLLTNHLVWAIITVTLNRSILSMLQERQSFQQRSSFLPTRIGSRSHGVSAAVELTDRPDHRYIDGKYGADGRAVHIERTYESFVPTQSSG
jgi:hypothetical protein